MNLATRITRLENAAGRKEVKLPNMVVHFVRPDGQTLPGGILSLGFGNPSPPKPYSEPLWIDDDGNPIPPPEWTTSRKG